MQTSGVVQGLLEDLSRAVALGDEKTAAVAEAISAALAGSVHVRLMEAMGEAAAEVTHQLPSGHVEVRLVGRDIDLVYVAETGGGPAPEDTLDARVTLRLPEGLKTSLEAAAAEQGVSVNTWIVRALSRNVDRKRTVGNRLTGFARG
jgi:hypothetical protein